jgi:hypothetical protein
MRLHTVALSALLAFVLVPCAAVSAQAGASPAGEQPLATISYAVGPVSITRDGQQVSAKDIGDPIYDDDYISTGAGASLSFDLLPRTGMRGSITLQPRTSMYFRMDLVKGEKQNQAELIAGQVGLKLKKIVGSPGMTVTTETAVCGVRGTEFQVTASPSGDVLIDCDEGEVSCSSDNVTASAVPGQVVEKRQGQRLARKALAASAYADYRRAWLADEEAAFARNAPKAARAILLRYLELQKKLGEVADALARDKDISAWMEQKRKGIAPSPADLAELGKRIADVAKRLAQAELLLGAMERIDARVAALGSALERGDKSAMRESLRPGFSVGDFFDRFGEMRARDQKRAAELRAGVRLFRQRANAIEEAKAAGH